MNPSLHVAIFIEICIDKLLKARGEIFQRNRFKSSGTKI